MGRKGMLLWADSRRLEQRCQMSSNKTRSPILSGYPKLMSHWLFSNHARNAVYATERCDLTRGANTFPLPAGERAGGGASVASDMRDIYNANPLRHLTL